METKAVTIRNKAGIHCRPSSAIMMAAEAFPGCKFSVRTIRGVTELNSILDLLSLGLQLGDEVEISVTGPQEAEACAKIAELFATEFDFV